MSLRKNKTVRDKVQERLEGRLDDLVAQADSVRQQLADRAPEVRDTVVAFNRTTAKVRGRKGRGGRFPPGRSATGCAFAQAITLASSHS